MSTIRIPLLPALLIALPAIGALGEYKIDLRQEMRGADVAVTATGGVNATVTMLNRAADPAVCRVDFEGGRVTPTRRTVLVAPNKSIEATIGVADETLDKLTVTASCEKQDPNLTVPTTPQK